MNALHKSWGKHQERPKDPENAVYEVCYIEDELYSVRMSEGYRDEDEEENGEPAKSDTDEDIEEYTEEDEKGEQSITGTYIGVHPPLVMKAGTG